MGGQMSKLPAPFGSLGFASKRALRFWLLLLGSISFAMCSSSESHIGGKKVFLTACESDSVCADEGGGQACFCVCTIPCQDDELCRTELVDSGLNPQNIVCRAPSCGDAASDAAAVCDVTCKRDSDCAPLSSSHRCDDGFCRAPAYDPDGDGGGGAGGASLLDPNCPLGGVLQEVPGGSICLSEREVTVLEFSACVSDGACTEPLLGNFFTSGREQFPINAVSPEQALAYCESKMGRLPTREEWEFAAGNGEGATYPWGEVVPGPADSPSRVCALSTPDTCEVQSYPDGNSTSGVSDLVGNVAEYVSDGAGYCTAGGSYEEADPAALTAASCPAFDEANLTDPDVMGTLGFRCVFPADVP